MQKPALMRKAASAVVATSAKRPRAWRLEVVKDLLADLQTATVAGRGFTIDKLVRILDEEAAAAGPDLSELQRRGLARALADLRTEQRRPWPRLDAFAIRVQTILWTLAPT